MCYLNDNNDRNRNLPVPSYSLSVSPAAELMRGKILERPENTVEIGKIAEAGKTGCFRYSQSLVFQ